MYKFLEKFHLVTTDVYDVALYKILGARVIGVEGSYPKLIFHLEIAGWHELYKKYIGIVPYKRFKHVREKLKIKYKESKFTEDASKKRLDQNLDLLKGAIVSSVLKELVVPKDAVMRAVGRVLKSYENKLYLKSPSLK